MEPDELEEVVYAMLGKELAESLRYEQERKLIVVDFIPEPGWHPQAQRRDIRDTLEGEGVRVLYFGGGEPEYGPGLRGLFEPVEVSVPPSDVARAVEIIKRLGFDVLDVR